MKDYSDELGMKAVRKRLDLSQNRLCELFNVSRSLISMTEYGKRLIPGKNALQLLKFKHLFESEDFKNARIEAVKELNSDPLLDRGTIEGYRYKYSDLQLKLAKMQKNADDALDKIAFYRLVLQQPDIENKEWFERELFMAEEKLKKCGIAVQVPLMIKIASLTAMIEKAEQFVFGSGE